MLIIPAVLLYFLEVEVSRGKSGDPRSFYSCLRECIWNELAVSLVLPTFNDTGSLGFPLRQVVYSPGSMVLPWVNALHFLEGNREVELKPTTFSSLILFRVFLSFLFS